MMMVFLILMIFGSKKVSSIDVLKYYSDKFVLEHYEEATGMVGLWESEKVVFQRSIQNKCDQLLEIGCGTGRISFGLSQLGYAKITATDFSMKMINRAKELNEKYKAKIDFQKQDATALTFEEAQFGAVIFGFNGLMQIPGELNRRKAMEESYRVLIPGVILSLPHIIDHYPSGRNFGQSKGRNGGKGNRIQSFWNLGIALRIPRGECYTFMSLKGTNFEQN